MRLVLFAVAAALLAGHAQAAPDGRAVFSAKCSGCHALTAKSGPAGPQLKAVIGRRLAGADDFTYSAGLKAKGGVWTEAALGSFLENPSAFAPGTRMFTRLSDGAERAAVIAYLKTAN